MQSLAVKIVIAGRTYPLTIDPSEEENLRQAARNIEESIESFQKNYAVNDKQDLLAMTALQMATQLVIKEKQSTSEEEAAGRIKKMEEKLNSWLEANTLP